MTPPPPPPTSVLVSVFASDCSNALCMSVYARLCMYMCVCIMSVTSIHEWSGIMHAVGPLLILPYHKDDIALMLTCTRASSWLRSTPPPTITPVLISQGYLREFMKILKSQRC